MMAWGMTEGLAQAVTHAGSNARTSAMITFYSIKSSCVGRVRETLASGRHYAELKTHAGKY